MKLAPSTELLIVASDREGTYFEVVDKRTKGVGRWRSPFDNGGHKKYVNHSSVTRPIGGRKEGLGTESFAALIFCGKKFRRGRRETMRRAVANDGLRDREGERRGLREGMPTDRKADIKLPRRRGGRRGGREKRLSSSHNKWSRSMAAGDR